MDALSISIINRVIKVRSTDNKFSFVLFKKYDGNIVTQMLYELHNIKPTCIKCIPKGDVYLYKCNIIPSSLNESNIQDFEQIIDEYNFLISNNLVMLIDTEHNKLINLKNGDTLIRIIRGDATKLIKNIWDGYIISAYYNGIITTLELKLAH